MIRALGFLSIFLLVGCARGLSSQQIGQMETQECLNYGFVQGTPQFAQCFERVDQNRIAQDDADHRVYMQHYLATYGHFNCYTCGIIQPQ